MAFVFEDEPSSGRFVFEDEQPRPPEREGFREGFVKPTAKALLRVPLHTAASMAQMPVSGLAAAAKLISSGGDLSAANRVLEENQRVLDEAYLTTPEERAGSANIGLAMKPFQMAGEGWGMIGKATGIPYAEPLLATLGEADAMFALPGAPKVIRGRAVPSDMNIFARGETPAVRLPNIGQDAAKSPYSPELAAELMRIGETRALPPGQGFEVVGNEPRGMGFEDLRAMGGNVDAATRGRGTGIPEQLERLRQALIEDNIRKEQERAQAEAFGIRDTEAPAPRFEFESDAFDMTQPFERGEIDFTAPEAKVKAAEAAPPKAKEPWEMTWEGEILSKEYTQVAKEYGEAKAAFEDIARDYYRSSKTTRKRMDKKFSESRRKASELENKWNRLYEAIRDFKEGKPVPPEVLKDYPELAKAGEAAVATTKVGGRVEKAAETPGNATLFSGVDPTLIIDKIANSKTGRAVIEFFDPGATIPKGNEWLIDRQAAKGGIARGETLAEKFVKTFKHLTEDERQQIWEFMDGRKPLSELPDKLQHPARRMRMIDNVIGNRLADEGVISAETYEANKGNHIRYIYNVYQQGQELMGGGGAKINRAAFSERHDWGQAATKKHLNDNFGYLPKQERGALHGFLDGVVDKADLPDHIKWIADQLVEKKAEFKDVEQSRMGLIKDPIQAMAQSITEGEKATAMSKYFKKIAGTPEWIFEPSVLKINGVKMGIGKAQSLVEAMESVGELNPEQIRFKAQLEGAIQEATAKMGKPPGDFIQLNGKNYGALDGMYVNKTIAQDIKPVFALGNESSSSLVNSIKSGSIVATGLWKMKNVALNIPTMARNVISNNIQLLMSGMGPHKLAIRIPEAILSLAKRDQDWRALMRQGAFKTNFATGELAELVEIAKTIKDAPNILELVSRMQRLGKFYGKIDDVFKLAKFKDLRGKGVETAEAARQSIRWGMDYSLAHPSIKALRSLPLGSPFITYQYKIAPLIVQSIKERPWVIGSIMALPYIVQKAVTSDMTDEDARQYIKSLPEYVKNGQVFLIPGTHGMNALDVSYMVPWGNWYQVLNSAASGKPTKAMKELGVSQGLIPTLTYASITGKDLFTGEEIVDPLERHDPRAAAWALTKYIWQVAMPPMLGEYGVAGKVAAHVQHGQTKQGLKTEGMNVWLRIGGANIYPVDPTGGTRQKAGEISEVRKALIRRMNDRNLEVEERKALIMLYRQSVSDIQEKYN